MADWRQRAADQARHAFAYVFAGGGKFCNASGPLAVPTEGVGWADTTLPREADNRSLVLFDRGDEVRDREGPRAGPPSRGLSHQAQGTGARLPVNTDYFSLFPLPSSPMSWGGPVMTTISSYHAV